MKRHNFAEKSMTKGHQEFLRKGIFGEFFVTVYAIF